MKISNQQVRKTFLQYVEDVFARIPQPIVTNVVKPVAAFSVLAGALTGTIGGAGGLAYAASKVSQSPPQAALVAAGSAAALYVGLHLRKIICDAAEEVNRLHPDYVYSLVKRRGSPDLGVRAQAVKECKRYGI